VSAPRLIWHTEVESPRAVVLILHGGKSRSQEPVRSWQPAVWWMLPFARAVRDAGHGSVSVAVLRYAVQGWNGANASPLADTILALEQVAARHPGLPIGLLGHSMGGRVALHLAGDERIGAIAALAPWVERADQPRWHRGLHLLVMHGTQDRITSARQSKTYADTLSAMGADVSYVSMAGSTHSMVRHAKAWREQSAHYLARHLLPPAPAT
jgi:alpha-beta hydrolase superfamily lysophospholipase